MISHYFIAGWQSIVQQKSRSLLSMFIIMIMAMLLHVSFGLEKGIANQLDDLGAQAQDTYSLRAAGLETWNFDRPPLSNTAYDTLSTIDEVSGRSFEYFYHQQITHDETAYETSVLVTNTSYARLRGLDLASGEFSVRANDTDHLVVLGSELATRIFNDSPAVGSKLTLGGTELTIIGVLESSPDIGLNLEHELNNSLLISRDTFELANAGSLQQLDRILFQLRRDAEPQAALTSIKSTIGQAVSSSDAELLPYSQTFSVDPVVQAFAWVIRAGLALGLLIGTASIANAMTAVVTSRQREIGLRKSVGAGGRDIFWQHSIEPALVGVTATVLSIGFCLLVTFVATAYYDIPMALDIKSMAIIAAVTVILPIMFSLHPAISAARTKPNNALRHE